MKPRSQLVDLFGQMMIMLWSLHMSAWAHASTHTLPCINTHMHLYTKKRKEIKSCGPYNLGSVLGPLCISVYSTLGWDGVDYWLIRASKVASVLFSGSLGKMFAFSNSRTFFDPELCPTRCECVRARAFCVCVCVTGHHTQGPTCAWQASYH